MITLGIVLAIVMASVLVYCTPGLVLARGMYAEAQREINSRHFTVVPPRPARPEVKMTEMLHIAGDRWGNPVGRCNLLDNNKRACNCSHRDEWIRLKNGWLEYNEWQERYGSIENAVTEDPKVNMKPIYWAVPGWPVVMAGMFIKGGAKSIPDYRAIERFENELKEL